MKHTIINNPLCIAVTMVILAGCGTDEAATAKEKPVTEAPATEAFIVQKGKLQSAMQIPGELIPFQQVDIYAKVNGFVRKVYADVGTEVKAGQLLAEMEAPELGSQLAGAESRLKAQEAIYTASKAQYDRLLETSKTPGTISPNDLDQANARRNADYAQWESAKSAYREIADTRNYLAIRAPFSGVISVRNVNPGAIAGPAGKGSELPLFVLQDQRKLRLAVAVPEQLTSFIGKSASIHFTVKSRPNEKFAAAIKRSSGALDLRLRAERIEMDIDNNDKRLLPGMIAEVNLPASAGDSTLLVPKTAVVNSPEKVFVIRVHDNKLQWVTVKTGRESDGKMEIYGEVQPGDTLLNVANEEKRDGSAVRKLVVK